MSVARNPILFDIFNRMQLIEKVGTGIKRIVSAVAERNLSVEFETGTFFTVIFSRPGLGEISEVSTMQAPSKHQASTKLALSRHHACKILGYCREARPIADIMAIFNRKDRTKFKKSFIAPLIAEDFLCMTLPNKPKSPLQKYIITEKGKQFLKINKGAGE